jgi:hypothetical protein
MVIVEKGSILKSSIEDASATVRDYLENDERLLGIFNDF